MYGFPNKKKTGVTTLSVTMFQSWIWKISPRQCFLKYGSQDHLLHMLHVLDKHEFFEFHPRKLRFNIVAGWFYTQKSLETFHQGYPNQLILGIGKGLQIIIFRQGKKDMFFASPNRDRHIPTSRDYLNTAYCEICI